MLPSNDNPCLFEYLKCTSFSVATVCNLKCQLGLCSFNSFKLSVRVSEISSMSGSYPLAICVVISLSIRSNVLPTHCMFHCSMFKWSVVPLHIVMILLVCIYNRHWYRFVVFRVCSGITSNIMSYLCIIC